MKRLGVPLIATSLACTLVGSSAVRRAISPGAVGRGGTAISLAPPPRWWLSPQGLDPTLVSAHIELGRDNLGLISKRGYLSWGLLLLYNNIVVPLWTI